MSDIQIGPEVVFEARGLTKRYGGARGVEGISLAVRRGEIFGFLGPNGAGKTTVLRTALGLLRPTGGEILLFGDAVRIECDKHHERLGYLPGDLRLWGGMTARRLSDLMLGIGPQTFSKSRRDELAARLGLDLDRRLRRLSMGNRQKAGLLLALQHEPELLVLDEPTTGLDPLVRRAVLEILRERADSGATVIYSSHNLAEVEHICTRVGILRSGRLVAVKKIDEIRIEREMGLECVVRRGAACPAGLPESIGDARLVSLGPDRFEVRYRGAPGPILEWLGGFDLVEVSTPQMSLEEAFLSYYEGGAEPGAVEIAEGES